MVRVWFRRAFWKNFGVDVDVAWRTWPEQEFRDAISILNAEAHVSRSASGSGPVPAETTQANFDALPRASRDDPPQESPPA